MDLEVGGGVRWGYVGWGVGLGARWGVVVVRNVSQITIGLHTYSYVQFVILCLVVDSSLFILLYLHSIDTCDINNNDIGDNGPK